MNGTSEQSIAHVLQHAVDRIDLPPESRWLPAARARSSADGGLLATAAAVVILLSVLAIPSFGPRTVPATAPDPFVAADDAAWARVRADMPANITVLRPTWIPAEFRGAGRAECPSPQVSVQNADRTYVVSYYGASFVMPPTSNRSSSCARLEFKTLKVAPAESFYGVQLVDAAPLSARGTTVRVRVGPRVFDQSGQPHQLIYLNWLEGGVSYELNTLDADLADLTHVLAGLEPMR